TTGLDDAADTHLGGVVDAVAEREEGVGRHHRAFHFQPGMLGLDGGDAGGIDAAHLAGADADSLAVFRVNDGVGFNELGHFPGEDQIVHFCFGRRALCDHLEVGFGDHADVAILYQQAAVDTLVVQAAGGGRVPFAAHQHAHV